MAWPEKLASGRYRGGYRRPGNPKKLYVDGTFALKRDAKEAAQEEEVKARRQAARSSGKLSARTAWGEWWELLEVDRRERPSDAHIKDRKLVRRYLMPRWGETPLNKIEQQHVQRWVNALTAGNVDGWTHRQARPPAPAYVRSVYGLFAATMNRAVKDLVLTASPCTGIDLPTVRKRAKPYMPVADAGKLELRDDYRDAVDFALETGLRPGELCGLHADHIEWSGWLRVDAVFVDRRGVIRPWPKDKDERRVPLTTKALAILRRRLDDRAATGGCGVPHADGGQCDSVLVFLTDRGKAMRPRGLNNAMRTANRNADMPQRPPYTLRRGYVTRAIAGGADIFAVQRYVGHADLEELAGYNQETPAARAAMLAALGEQTPLTVVGQHGAAHGADLDGNTVEGTGISTIGTAG